MKKYVRLLAAAVMAVLCTFSVFPEFVYADGIKSIQLETKMNWEDADNFGGNEMTAAQVRVGLAFGFYIFENGDGTVSALIAPSAEQHYDWDTGVWSYTSDPDFMVERYDAGGKIVYTKTIRMELPYFVAFCSGKEYNYVAFGDMNPDCDDTKEVWRIVQYDKNWNKCSHVSLYGGESYTTQAAIPHTISRMTENEDGTSVVLYSARTRYDGHQSNATFFLDIYPERKEPSERMKLGKNMGGQWPVNHVSHSFGQFVRFDGDSVVTVDHGDAYPRSFVFQKITDFQCTEEIDLMSIYGNIGDNRTNAIGSGFEVSDSGYLFLGCSDPQTGESDQPWNVFLTYKPKDSMDVKLTWLTDETKSVNCARLVKLNKNSFVAMWSQSDGLHWQALNGEGEKVGTENILTGVPMPPVQPSVRGRAIRWIQTAPGTSTPRLYSLEIPISVITSRGDINQDGAVTEADCDILARYFAGWEGYEDKICSKEEADIDGNGAVERRDAVLLARYLADWDGLMID